MQGILIARSFEGCNFPFSVFNSDKAMCMNKFLFYTNFMLICSVDNFDLHSICQLIELLIWHIITLQIGLHLQIS